MIIEFPKDIKSKDRGFSKEIQEKLDEIHAHNATYFIQNYKKEINKQVMFLGVFDAIYGKEKAKEISEMIKPFHSKDEERCGDVYFYIKPIEKYIINEYTWEKIEDFLSMLKGYIPNEKMEYIDGFVNIWWPKEALRYSVKCILEKNDGNFKLNYIEF